MNDGKKNNNVIYFPGMKDQLRKKGLEYLQQKNYTEATPFLENLKMLDPENSNIYIGLLLAYFDGGMVDKALSLVREMMQKGVGDEIDTVNIYILLLVQRHEYEQVILVIKKILDEDISDERREYFSSLLYFSQEMTANQIEIKKVQDDTNIHHEIDFFQYKDSQEQMLVAKKLKDRNIVPYINDIKQYLLSVDGDLFFKTLLINVLKEHQYDKPIEVEKFGRTQKVIPNHLRDITENNEIMVLINLIGQKLEHEDPILFESIYSLINRHVFLLYPFSLDFIDLPAWAAAYHELGNEYFGNTHTEGELIKVYGTQQAEMRKAKNFIRMIEEKSYRNM